MLVIPSFNGQFIFGIDVTMVTVDPPRETQVNAFQGVNGIETIDHGSRQRYTNVTGRFVAPDLATLGALENTFRSYKDPFAYTLVTTEGLAWDEVKLESFEPTPRIGSDGVSVWRSYHARFIHLI
jgi:hypothetical protein